jgi:hypothetical protein
VCYAGKNPDVLIRYLLDKAKESEEDARGHVLHPSNSKLMATDGSMTATIQALRRDVSVLTAFVRRAMQHDDDNKHPAKKLALTTAQVPEVELQRPPQAPTVPPPSSSPGYTLSGGLQLANDTLELPRPRDWVAFALFYHVASPERALYRETLPTVHELHGPVVRQAQEPRAQVCPSNHACHARPAF